MIRIFFLIIVLALVFYLLRWFMNTPSARVAGHLKKAGVIALASFLVVLAVLGKLSGLIALIGVLVASLLRCIPYFLRYFPQLQGLWNHFKKKRKAKPDNSAGRVNLGEMTIFQAYEILGLKPGASHQEIIQAHRKLMQKNHPDRGGSTYLAAQINRAKKILLDL